MHATARAKPLVLWATLRSTSTAFEWMMAERGDFDVIHEPFGKSYYLSLERKSNRYSNMEFQSESNYYASILSMIQEKNCSKRVFIKDMAFYISHILSDDFLQGFEHTFLIRHPAKVLPSLFDKWQDFTFEEAGYQSLHELFQRVKGLSLQPPALIDSDDLLRNPSGIVDSYCKRVGIPFMAEALQWQPKSRHDIYWDSDIWHSQVEQSRAFERQENKNYVSVRDNQYLRKMYDDCLPFYQKLYEYRLTA